MASMTMKESTLHHLSSHVAGQRGGSNAMKRTPPLLRPLVAVLALLGAAGGDAHAAGFPWKSLAAKSDAWYRTDEAARLARNVLSQLSDRGNWPKNIDTSVAPYQGDRSRLRGTFDNGATVGEMRFLAPAFVDTGNAQYRNAFLKAFDHGLAARYPNGGWPRSYPPGEGYARHITFNDNTMVNLMELVRGVARSDGFAFVDRARREAADRAFASGVACVLK
jgi:pectate lyase